MKYSAMILVGGGGAVEGMENFEADSFVGAAAQAQEYASMVGGRVLRVESSDFGAFEFMR